MQERGINNSDHVVVYDCSDFGIFSAPRLWWMFRVFGHRHVSVLDGGFALWKAQQLSIESGPNVGFNFVLRLIFLEF